MTFDWNSFLSAIIGGLLTIIATLLALGHTNKKEKEKKFDEERKLQEKFFMELNYNRRKIIYTIKNEDYTLIELDNIHWKNFIYSHASQILMGDKELIDVLATLDSMIGQTNNRATHIKELEIAKLCNKGNAVIGRDDVRRVRLSLQQYAKDELLPQMENAITSVEKLLDSGEHLSRIK